MPPTHLALGLWAEKSGISRQMYTRLRQVFSLVSDHPLPAKLDTLKRHVRQRIPMLQIMRKAIPVTIQKQASFGRTDKKKEIIRKSSWMYWFDPADFVRNILKASQLREQMYFGMAQYHDHPTELWHSKAWGSSIRATSGDVVLDHQGMLVVPGDIIVFTGGTYFDKGRVVFIGRDFRQTTDQEFHGTVVITVQQVLFWKELTVGFQSLMPVPEFPDQELYLIEDEETEVQPGAICGHPDVLMDRDFEIGDSDSEGVAEDQHFIRRVLNVSSGTCRLVRQLHPVSGELEVEESGRDHLQDTFAGNIPVYSLPFALFIDDFGIHRNSYRALKAFYWIPSSLPYEERRKLANVFTLTLGPHGAIMDDVVEAFYKDFRALDQGGYVMDVNGEESLVCAYSMMMIGDMPQQADNSGFMRHTARFGCRSCFCTSEQRHDLGFDVIEHSRYHHLTIQSRRKLQHLTGQEAARFTRETGIRKDSPALTKMTPALDLILSRTIDVPHSEWRGIGRILQGLLFSAILTKKGGDAYLKSFQSFQYPASWPRIQSPAYYVWSWSLSESGRATILTPLILRAHAHSSWFKFKYLEAAAQLSWVHRRWNPPELVHEWLLKARECYQLLIQCAEDAGGEKPYVDVETDTDARPPGHVIEQVIDQVVAEVDVDDLDVDEANDMDVDDESDLGVEIDKKDKGKGKAPATATAKPKRKRGRPRGQMTKYQKLMGLPNVHAGLHIADVARQYATAMNCNVLPGELKHNWEDHTELVKALAEVERRCPTLIQSFQPVTERDIADEEEEDENTKIQGDDRYTNIPCDYRYVQDRTEG
ncbi:MAG: hypothetical protein Q9196_000960 [Gyalolechia fulgens]